MPNSSKGCRKHLDSIQEQSLHFEHSQPSRNNLVKQMMKSRCDTLLGKSHTCRQTFDLSIVCPPLLQLKLYSRTQSCLSLPVPDRMVVFQPLPGQLLFSLLRFSQNSSHTCTRAEFNCSLLCSQSDFMDSPKLLLSLDPPSKPLSQRQKRAVCPPMPVCFSCPPLSLFAVSLPYFQPSLSSSPSPVSVKKHPPPPADLAFRSWHKTWLGNWFRITFHFYPPFFSRSLHLQLHSQTVHPLGVPRTAA